MKSNLSSPQITVGASRVAALNAGAGRVKMLRPGVLLALAVVVIAAQGCGSRQINRYVGQMKPLPTLPDTSIVGITRDSIAGGELFKLTPVSESRSTQELILFSPHAGLLWPGALIQGSSVDGGVFADAPVRRQPIDVYIEGAWNADTTLLRVSRDSPSMFRESLDRTASYKIDTPTIFDLADSSYGRLRTVPIARHIDKPTAGTVEQARLDILRNMSGIPAVFELIDQQFWSEEQALFSMGASASWATGSLKASLATEASKRLSSIVVKLTQRYFTYALSARPEPPSKAFGRGVGTSDLRRVSDITANPLTFVRSVTYGKMAILTVTSSEKYDVLKASLQASLKATFASGSIDMNKQEFKAVREGTVKLWVYGGPFPTDAPVELGGDKLAELRRYLAVGTPSDLRTGVPISYRIDYLKDGFAAKLGLATEYTRVSRTLAPQLLEPTVSFLLGNEDKDDDTGIYAQVRRSSNNRVIAQASFQDGHWNDGSPHGPYGLTMNEVLLSGDLPDAVFEFCILPNGNDTVQFNDVIVRARRHDGTNYEVHFGAVRLNQNARCTGWRLAAY